MQLCALHLKRDNSFLLELLSVVLDPDNKFNTFNLSRQATIPYVPSLAANAVKSGENTSGSQTTTSTAATTTTNSIQLPAVPSSTAASAATTSTTTTSSIATSAAATTAANTKQSTPTTTTAPGTVSKHQFDSQQILFHISLIYLFLHFLISCAKSKWQ